MNNKVIVSMGILIFIFTANCAVVPGRSAQQIIQGVPDEYASAALNAWEGVQFDTALVEQISDRAIENSAGNSKIWVTTVNDNCVAPGIDRELCNFGAQTIAICQVQYFRRSGIIQTAIIYLREMYIKSEGFSDSEKKATLIHEIGHCIGLQHWTEGASTEARQNIMYPFLTDRIKPSSEEIAAVKDVYPKGQSSSRVPTLDAHASRYANGQRRQAITNPEVIFTSAASNLGGENAFSTALSATEDDDTGTTIYSIQGEKDPDEQGHECKENGNGPKPQQD